MIFSLSPHLPVSLSTRLRGNVDGTLALIVVLAIFLFYLRTLAPDVVDADGGEFQFAAWNFSFVHPTGYPLYLILGGIFQHLVPLGNPAYRLNLFTAITAALAVGAVYLASQEITNHRGAAMIAAASFALTRTFWYDASAAETYDLNAFFVALLIYIALRWQAEPTTKKFAAFCFANGLALTHHRTVLLWLPVFALFFVIVAWDKLRGFKFQVSRSNLMLLAFSFLLPFALYLYIPLRAPASPYATIPLAPGRDLILYDNSVTGFVNYFLGRVFQNDIGWDAVSVSRLASIPQLLLDQFGAIGVVLGIVGFAAMMWRKREVWARLVLLVGGLAATILFASIYHIGDIFHYYIPAYLVWAMWIGIGLSTLIDLFPRRLTADRRQLFTAFCSLCVLTAFLLLGFQLVSNYSSADRSHETQAREQWTRTLRVSAPIPQNAILISDNRDEMMPLWYMQYVENVRRDVVGLFPIITPAPEHQNIGRLTDSVLDTGRPVYFIKPMPGIEIKYRIESLGGLTHVLGQAADTPPQFKTDVTLGNRVRVIGYTFTREATRLRVALYFQMREKLDGNYTGSLQLFGARGGKVAQGTDHQVGGDYYPTSLWRVDEVLRDEFIVDLPADLAPSTYHLFVSMYRQLDLEPLGEPVELGWVEIQ